MIIRTPRMRCAMGFAPALILAGAVASTRGAVFDVGDGQPYASISAVPWENLAAGDEVRIHWRPAPYREKWVVSGPGTAAAPIIVRGVPGPAGELPVIDGENATTRTQLSYWNEVRSVIKVGGSSVPPDIQPTWIVIEGLDVRGARPPNTFTDDDGAVQTYATNAAAVHVERGANVIIRGCILRDCGNGLFVSSSDDETADDILIDGNYIHANGNAGSIFHHNTYTAARGIVYQFNRFGPLLAGAGGNNLKDRSAGLVVRCNWIEGGNRQLDLVDGEDSGLIRNDPRYRQTLVYGNILIEPDGAGNRQVIHYGGDSGATAAYRKGTLHLYHNTVVSTRTDRTTLMRLSTNDERCDARDNIFYAAAGGATWAMLDQSGVLDLRRNWIRPGWVDTFGTLDGTINDDGTAIEGTNPGFADFAAQDFALLETSPCIDAALPLHDDIPPEHAVTQEYVRHQSGRSRAVSGAALDLGAFEFAPGCTLLCGDLDASGFVDLNDFHSFATCYGLAAPDPSCPDPLYTCVDLNADGAIDLADLSTFSALFGTAPFSSPPDCLP